ncbi:MAG: hypothetical protein GY754_19045 [bacterium]|nr:hypothetical protein [bacterium]
MLRNEIHLKLIVVITNVLLLIMLQSVGAEETNDPGIFLDSSGLFLLVQLGCPLTNNITNNDNIFYASDFILKGAYRFGSWGLFALAEFNMWKKLEYDEEEIQAACNLGIGAEFIYFEGRGVSSLGAGPAIKITDNVLKEAGEVGFFIDLRPVGIRFKLNESIFLNFDPLTLNIEAPVLSGIPLVVLEFRSIFSLEIKI